MRGIGLDLLARFVRGKGVKERRESEGYEGDG
jgi:hypothetical protein